MAIKGAILGDIIGSQYEFKRPDDFDNKTALLLTEKCKFTDDTVMSIATKYAIEHKMDFAKAYQFFGLKYRNVGYGTRFAEWIDEQEKEPYESYGNGSAMRVSFVADYFYLKDKVIEYATKSAECSHNHQLSLDEIRKTYKWNETCQGSVPVAIRCVYEANNYTEFIRNVFSLNCDTDTLCAIGGGIAEELLDNTYDEILPFYNDIFAKYLDEFLLETLYEKI